MAIDLLTFASGDVDYISRMNANVTEIKSAIDALQQQAGSATGVNPITVGLFWEALFNSEDCLIGPGSYVPFQSGSTVVVSAGAFYLGGNQTPVSKATETILTMTGQTAGTKYIVIGATGIPSIHTAQNPGSAYSVVWTGSAFVGQPIRIANCLFDAVEATASRESTKLGDLLSPPEDQIFPTLDDRLEATEDIAMDAKAAADQALTIVYEAGFVPPERIRKVGCTVNNTAGVKGAIQVDFAGTIIGWSIIGNQAGTISVSVSKKLSSQPPAAPSIPDPVTDKISASAPVALTGGQSASSENLPTWDVDVFPWDVIQFTVDGAASVLSATLYLRIREN